MEFPSIEVRYENLGVEAVCEVVEGKALPTLWNSLKRVFLVSILKNVMWSSTFVVAGVEFYSFFFRSW